VQFRLLAATQQLDDRSTDHFDAQASCRQHFSRNTADFVQQPEQQVLGAYVLVQQPVGFFGRILQRALAGSAERDLLRVRDSLAARDATDDVMTHIVEGALGSREDAAAKSLALVQDPQEDVLRLNSAGPELADLGAGVEENLECW